MFSTPIAAYGRITVLGYSFQKSAIMSSYGNSWKVGSVTFSMLIAGGSHETSTGGKDCTCAHQLQFPASPSYGLRDRSQISSGFLALHQEARRG